MQLIFNVFKSLILSRNELELMHETVGERFSETQESKDGVEEDREREIQYI